MVSNPLSAFARRLGQQPWLMRTAPIVPRLERFVRRRTRGRVGVLDIAGLPSIEITVIGRKTGIPRTTPLLAVLDQDRLLVIGSNWGNVHHPAWSANLRATPTAVIRYRREQFEVAVTEITGVERKRAWDHAVEFWPGYEMEYQLSGRREFRIFELRRR